MLRMLSDFLTEDLFKKGLAVSACGQPVEAAVWWGALLQPLPLAPKPWPTTEVE